MHNVHENYNEEEEKQEKMDMYLASKPVYKESLLTIFMVKLYSYIQEISNDEFEILKSQLIKLF